MNIRKQNQWVLWNIDKQNPKRPYRSDGITPAKTTDPQTWAPWKKVKEFPYVGLIITEGLIFVDLDHVIIHGKLVAWAKKLLKKTEPSYVEISPSGDGIHCLFKGHWPEHLRNKKKINGNQAIEVYGKDRYSTITANPFYGSPLKVNKLKGTYLQELMGELKQDKLEYKGHTNSGKTVEEIKKMLKEHDQWPSLDDALGEEWKSEDDYKFLCHIANQIGMPDSDLICQVYLASNIVRKKVAKRIDYHVARMLSVHEFKERSALKHSDVSSTRERITSLKLTKNKAKKMLDTEMLIPGLIARGHHAYIFGPAGSNKTTVIAALSMQMAKEHGVYVDFWSFDASPSHNAAMERLSRKRGVSNLVSIIAGFTIKEFNEHYNQAIEKREDLSDTVIVLDTYKFLVSDVNNKKESQKGMHYIKSLQQLGGTFISLGHTNKDGENHSGTAEVEQDSDAIFRIDRTTNEITGEAIATISKAGRVRYETRDLSYRMKPRQEDFWYSSMKSVKLMEEAVDVQGERKRQEALKKDEVAIQPIRSLIKHGTYTQSEIVDNLKGVISRNTVLKYLTRWEGILWKSNQDRHKKNAITYHSLEVLRNESGD